jgi:hypothetical protein
VVRHLHNLLDPPSPFQCERRLTRRGATSRGVLAQEGAGSQCEPSLECNQFFCNRHFGTKPKIERSWDRSIDRGSCAGAEVVRLRPVRSQMQKIRVDNKSVSQSSVEVYLSTD